MTKRRATNASAKETYAKRRDDIARLLDALQAELDRHAQDTKADPRAWGRAGDLAYVRESLITLVAFASGRETEDVRRFLDEGE